MMGIQSGLGYSSAFPTLGGMKNLFFLLLFCCAFRLAAQDFSAYVNPMTGTGGVGHTFPGATVPYGMVQMSPDTRNDASWEGCGGYWYKDSLIYGFSHTHLSGTGCSDYGDVLLMPGSGKPQFRPRDYGSPFQHQSEKASTGYYSVELSDHNIRCELTASTRAGIHTYRIRKSISYYYSTIRATSTTFCTSTTTTNSSISCYHRISRSTTSSAPV
jgi:putative alpha-1,2-mannosidase